MSRVGEPQLEPVAVDAAVKTVMEDATLAADAHELDTDQRREMYARLADQFRRYAGPHDCA